MAPSASVSPVPWMERKGSREAILQAFVFVGLRFAGTLSPTVMDSRTDGALAEMRFMSGYQLEAAFLRYADADPLCCPSRVSAVRYRIELPATLPRVVPMSVWSRSTRSN